MAGRRRTARHGLEARSELLAGALKHRIDTTAQALTPRGARPPFTAKKSAAEALAFWAAHRYDQYGQAILQHMTPLQIAELDVWLSQAMAHPAAAALPITHPLPGGEEILNRAMSTERTMEGPPIPAVLA